MNHRPYIIGVAGGSASGKTSMLRQLMSELDEKDISWLAMDNYYRPIEEQPKDENGKENFDLPESINQESFLSDLTQLMEGKEVTIDEYTFNVRGQQKNRLTITSAPILIVDGLFILHWKKLEELLDLKVFVHTPLDLMLERRLLRDEKERNYRKEDILYQWNNHVLPSYKEFLEPYIDDCHLVINNKVNYKKGLEVLLNHIQSILK